MSDVMCERLAPRVSGWVTSLKCNWCAAVETSSVDPTYKEEDVVGPWRDEAKLSDDA